MSLRLGSTLSVTKILGLWQEEQTSHLPLPLLPQVWGCGEEEERKLWAQPLALLLPELG